MNKDLKEVRGLAKWESGGRIVQPEKSLSKDPKIFSQLTGKKQDDQWLKGKE